VDDVAVLKADLGESAANLGAKFNPIDRGKLAQELEARADIPLKRHADRHAGQRKRGRRTRRRPDETRAYNNAGRDEPQCDQSAGQGLRLGLVRAQTGQFLGIRPDSRTGMQGALRLDVGIKIRGVHGGPCSIGVQDGFYLSIGTI